MSDEFDLQFADGLVQAHPWHGVDPAVSGGQLTVYVENTPLAMMKYEVDPASGILRIDHPNDTSALPPAAYGFVPRTLCGTRVAQINSRLRGDRAPLDVYVLSERPIDVAGVLAEVRIVGGVPVKDESYVDDKLVAVLVRDPFYGQMHEVGEIPIHVIERLCHYLVQGSVTGSTDVGDPFGATRALELLAAALADYEHKFPAR